MGRPLHRLREPAMSEPAPRPTVDVRVGSSTDGLAPVSVAERSTAAGRTMDRSRRGRGSSRHRRPGHEAHRRRHARPPQSPDTSPGRSTCITCRTRGSRSGSFRRRQRSSSQLTAMVIAWLLVVFARWGARHPVDARRPRPRRSAAASRTSPTASGSDMSLTSSTSNSGRRSISPTPSSSWVYLGLTTCCSAENRKRSCGCGRQRQKGFPVTRFS